MGKENLSLNQKKYLKVQFVQRTSQVLLSFIEEYIYFITKKKKKKVRQTRLSVFYATVIQKDL